MYPIVFNRSNRRPAYSVTLGYFPMSAFRNSYLADFLVAQLYNRRRLKTILKGMLHVFALRYPLKICDAVVALVSVYMVNARLVERVVDEGCGNDTMDIFDIS